MRVLAFLIEQRFFLSLFFFFNLGSLEICAITYILQLQNVPLYANTSLQFSTEMAVSDNLKHKQLLRWKFISLSVNADFLAQLVQNAFT